MTYYYFEVWLDRTEPKFLKKKKKINKQKVRISLSAVRRDELAFNLVRQTLKVHRFHCSAKALRENIR